MRTTTEICTETQDLIAAANRAFVPAPVQKLIELFAEFMAATAAELAAMQPQAAEQSADPATTPGGA